MSMKNDIVDSVPSDPNFHSHTFWKHELDTDVNVDDLLSELM